MRVVTAAALAALLVGVIGTLRSAAAATKDPTIFVANDYDVTAYPVGSHGDVSPIAVTTDMASPNGIARDASGRIYVTNDPTGTVTVYAASASGNVPPIAVIGGSNTLLDEPFAIALDASGRIYVLNGGDSGKVTVYPPLAASTGILNEAPIAVIVGSNTLLSRPAGIAVDASGDIYVANQQGGPIGPGDIYAPGVITIYHAGNNGNVAPTATISGAATGLVYPLGIALDSFGNIYVSNSEGGFYGAVMITFDASVTVYTAGTDGNVAPIRTISGPSTGLGSSAGVVLDSSGNVYTAGFLDGVGDTVNSYAAGSNGNVSPLTSIIGRDTGLDGPGGIALDSAGSLYVSNNGGGPTGGGSITIYPPGSSGDAGPTTTITSSFTELPSASCIAVDSVGNIYVANYWGSIDIYAAGSYATGSPIATITGDDTGLYFPLGIALDSAGNIFVLNDDNAVTVYPANSSGDATPKATVSIDRNGKSVPTGIAVDAHGNLYVTSRAGVKCKDNGLFCKKISSANVAVYRAGSHGHANASAVISGPNTQLESPSAIAVDHSGNIYVTDEGPAKCSDGCCLNSGPGSVSVYAPGSGGDAAPIATIEGKKTGLWFPYGIALDSKGNIYVLNDGSPIFYGGCVGLFEYNGGAPISIFAAGGNGDIAPIGGIGGSYTGLYDAGGIAIGPANP
jgi:sugar lactone lactonase YvrE